MAKGFEKLVVWQEAKGLAIAVFQVAREAPLCKEWALRDQMQRAAISVSSNIAEGFERESLKDELRFLSIAKGSVSELRSQVIIAGEMGLLEHEEGRRLNDHCHRVGSLIFKLMTHKRGLLEDRHLSA